MAILAPFSDPIELKKFDFSQNTMGMPLCPFGGSKKPKKGFFSLFEVKMTKIDILNLKLIDPDDYQQFGYIFSGF